MFKNYVITAFRNIRRNRMTSFLNIAGLSTGIACSMLILFHVKDELSYDTMYPEAEKLYRVTMSNTLQGQTTHWAVVSPLHGEYMKNFFPEIEQFARFSQANSFALGYNPGNGKSRKFIEAHGFAADSTVLDMFDVQFIKGKREGALNGVASIIITESLAKKLFDSENPLHKTLTVDNDTTLVMVTGVVKDQPKNTHLQFDYLFAMPGLYEFMRNAGFGAMLENRNWAGMYTYVRIRENASIESMQARIPQFLTSFYSGLAAPEELLSMFRADLQPVTNIHLHSKLEQEMGPNGDIAYIYIFSAIALLILIIAGMNYVNISNTIAMKRMKETGIRKLAGARKSQIIGQFMGESFFIIFISTLIAIELLHIALPFYNNLAGKSTTISSLLTFSNIAAASFLILLTGVFSGIYPALFMAGFNPVKSFKGIKDPRSATAAVRKGLVIFQFAIAVFLLFSTVVIFQQMEFFRTKDLGFDKDRIIAVKLNNELREMAVHSPETLKKELLQYSGISSVSIVSNLPGERFSVESLRPDGFPDGETLPQMRFLRVDRDFIGTLGIELADGRSFREVSGNSPAFILNEKAAEALQLRAPVGKMATALFDIRGQIAGVVKDFHFASFHNAIEPLVLEYLPPEGAFNSMRKLVIRDMLVKIRGGSITAALSYMEGKIKEIAPESFFSYSFLDDNLNRLYESEGNMSALFQVFALLAVIITGLGLFGLAAYSAELRTKEVGIRKTLGATIFSLVRTLSGEYLLWVGIATAIGLPAAYYFVHAWLQNFAYRINIGIGPFLTAAALALLVAQLAVGFQVVKAARANPVEALRYE